MLHASMNWVWKRKYTLIEFYSFYQEHNKKSSADQQVLKLSKYNLRWITCGILLCIMVYFLKNKNEPKIEKSCLKKQKKHPTAFFKYK